MFKIELLVLSYLWNGKSYNKYVRRQEYFDGK